MNRKLLTSLASNFALLLAIYLGAWQDIVWVAWPLIGFVWTMCLFYFSALYLGPAKEPIADPVPRWLGWTVDAASIFMFLHADWYYTATVYALSAFVLEAIYRSRRPIATAKY
jgi:hypothetical protein